jgi:hypothetical protein
MIVASHTKHTGEVEMDIREMLQSLTEGDGLESRRHVSLAFCYTIWSATFEYNSPGQKQLRLNVMGEHGEDALEVLTRLYTQVQALTQAMPELRRALTYNA